MNSKTHIIFALLILTTLAPLSAQVNVLCVGNSITWGTGLSDPSANSYPSQLDDLLGSNYDVTNRGEPGSTLLYWPDHSYMGSNQFFFALDTGPWDIIIICLGTNDSDIDVWYNNSNFVDDYKSLINAYISNNIIKWGQADAPVFILGFPPPVFDESKGHRNAPIHDEIIPMVKQLAEDLGHTTADFYSAMAGKPELYSDGVHPNEQGALLMAQVAQSAIQNALTTSGPAPDTPTGLTTIPKLYSIDLEWHANLETDIFQYRIYRSLSEYGFQNKIGDVLASDTTYSDNTVIRDKIYYYAIDVVDIEGNASGRSHAVPGKTYDQVPPSAPNNLSAFLEADSIKLEWTPNTENDLSRYYIFRNTNQNDLQNSTSIIATVYPPFSSYNDVDYISAVKQYYGVKAQDVSGNLSSLSNIIDITARSRPVCQDTTINAFEDQKRFLSNLDFPFADEDGDILSQIIFLDTDKWQYFQYDSDSIENRVVCEDISQLSFRADTNASGVNFASFKFKAIDSFGSSSSDTNTVIINVLPVNDEPTLDPIDNIHLIEDSHEILLQISGIGSGQAEENQTLSIEIIPPDTAFFNSGRIQYTSPDEIGFVTIDPKENVFGEHLMTIRVWDDGGTENGGINNTDESFYLNIEPRNDPPIINTETIYIYEDSDTTITVGGIYAGPWESGQNISMSVSSDNSDILPTPSLSYFSPDTFALLTFTTIPHVNGFTSITVDMSDDGGDELGGTFSTSYTIPIEIVSVNDRPSDFNISAPIADSTIVINKHNMNSTFNIEWESSSDIEEQSITYDIIFENDFVGLSKYGLRSTNTDFILKDILAETDTISVVTDNYKIVASDGDLETEALNSGLSITFDGRSFAPAKLNLDQNYPNPFNHNTLIGFDLPKRSAVSLSIIDMLGKEVIKLVDNEFFERGYSTVPWDGLDVNYDHVPSGIYFIRINVSSEFLFKKMVLLK